MAFFGTLSLSNREDILSESWIRIRFSGRINMMSFYTIPKRLPFDALYSVTHSYSLGAHRGRVLLRGFYRDAISPTRRIKHFRYTFECHQTCCKRLSIVTTFLIMTISNENKETIMLGTNYLKLCTSHEVKHHWQ